MSGVVWTKELTRRAWNTGEVVTKIEGSGPYSAIVGMTREKTSEPLTQLEGQSTLCEKCGFYMMPGDWPWCRGRIEDHIRE